jgi:glucosamine-6-phosphate deaminase
MSKALTSKVAPKYRFQVEGVDVQVFEDKVTLAISAAAFAADCIRRSLVERGETALILATGASQYEFLDALRQVENVDWSKVTAFHLDEYLNISAQHPASFRRYLRERILDLLPFGAVHLLEGDALDPGQECRRYASLLAERTIDLACIGIGENGHLAFNDPPADFDTPDLVHIVTLNEACRRQQVFEGHFAAIDDVPEKALSVSIPAILSVRTISCVVPDLRKARAVRDTLERPISPKRPASSLRRHADCHLYLDVDSASLLSPATTGRAFHL